LILFSEPPEPAPPGLAGRLNREFVPPPDDDEEPDEEPDPVDPVEPVGPVDDGTVVPVAERRSTSAPSNLGEDRDGVTTASQLGATGGSAGGLLMGIMLTQYPERFGALACKSLAG
jgi:hypothetical protein